MTRAAAVFLLAAVGLGACSVKLSFDPPDAKAASDAKPASDAARGCKTDQDCPLTTLHCDSSSGQCLACVEDGNCTSASSAHCDAALHRCVQCGADQDCGAAGRCIAATRSCVHTCATGADCSAAGTWCDDSVCSQCDDDHPCTGSRAYCDSATRQCTSCVMDAQCTAPGAPHCNRTSGQCVGCLSTADCAAGFCDPTNWTCKTPP